MEIRDFTQKDKEIISRRMMKSVGCLIPIAAIFLVFTITVILFIANDDVYLPLIFLVLFSMIFPLVILFESLKYRNSLKKAKKKINNGIITDKTESHGKHGAYYKLYIGEKRFDVDVTKYTSVNIGDEVEIECCSESDYVLNISLLNKKEKHEQKPAEDRLKELKELKDKNLISEEEYNKKREDILNNI
jgi:hypothetical protein